MATSSEVQRCIAELELPSFSKDHLMSFTSNLSESNKIGSGGCAKVYKGQLPNGIPIAVKVLEIMDVGEDTFMTEVGAIGKARHLNLIKLYGYCFEDNMKALMYEYMQNGSLDKILYENNHAGSIEWVKLYDIAIGIANGLKYLHHDLEEQIIHYDVKPANVLLGENFSPKLGDFGLAKTMQRDVSRVDVSRIRGTYGYMAPEIYTPESQVSCKCDVYSFGMTLFEILGKRSNGVEENWFPKVVWKQFENGNVEHFIRTNCGIAEKDEENANILCKIALWCVQYNPDLRPSMKDVVLMLEKEKLVKDPPCPSSEFRKRKWSDEMELDPTYLQNITAGPTYELVADPKPTQSYEIVSSGDFDAFVSRESTTKEIVEALEDGKIGLIGVFGMPGVGKTMLLDAISNQVKKERMFDKVVKVIVSQNPDLEKIQDNIAKGLDLRFGDGDNSETKKAKLFARINQDKKTLVMLDDVWERLEIAEVGIPHKNVNKDCKVVFTTRDRGVCGRMESDVSIEVTTLTAEDSWQLFRKRAGDVPHNSILPVIAKDIANECKGLPLAIATLGRALRDKGESVWNSALRLLRKSNFDGMSPVFSSIKMSYDFLGSEEKKMCFLFCCLYPEDYQIDTNNIFFHVMGEKLFRNADTFLDARSSFDWIIDELVSSCLLLRDEEGYLTQGYVMLHDVVRDVAISIASSEENNYRFIVKAGVNLRWWPDVELGNCNRLSLMSNKIICLPPYQIKAPNLLTLCLNENSDIQEIPSEFFEGMQNLTTLDLSRTQIESLPPSFSYLRSLHVLRMDNCENLFDISQIEKLDRLEILSFRGYKKKIRSWESLGKLTTLKILDLSDDLGRGFLPPGEVISNLHRLEELRYLGYQRDDDVNQIYFIGLSEIACLTRLTCLHMNLSTDECNSQLVLPAHWENLTEFIFVCHSGNFYHVDLKFLLKEWWNLKKRMYLQLPSISVPNWILVLSGWTNCLFLRSCPHLISVDQLDPSGMFDNLKVLDIDDCESMTHLYSTASSCEAKAPMYAFRNLETLQLFWVPKLVAFCDGTLPQGFFQNLKFLKVSWCKKVIILIPCDLLERLQNLETLVVGDCRQMEKVVQLTSNATKSMSSSGTSFPIFPKLRELHISYCHKLKYLLPMRVLRELRQLEILEIYENSNMVMIVEHENYEEDEVVDVDQDKAILPRLKSLDLLVLPELMSFCPSSLLFDWPALEYLRVYKCPRLNRLPLHTNSAPKLRTLDVEQQWFDGLEWEDQSLKSRLQALLLTVEQSEEEEEGSEEQCFSRQLNDDEWEDESLKSRLQPLLVTVEQSEGSEEQPKESEE